MKLSFMLNEERILTGLTGGDRSKKEIIGDLLIALYDGTQLKNEESPKTNCWIPCSAANGK
jgi:hypothetical protein